MNSLRINLIFKGCNLMDKKKKIAAYTVIGILIFTMLFTMFSAIIAAF